MCGYFGAIIDAQTANARDKEHEKQGYPPAIYKYQVTNSLTHTLGGQPVIPEENPGTWFNHSVDSRNVKAAKAAMGDSVRTNVSSN